MRELIIERALKRRIEVDLKGLCIKIPPIFLKGIPDRLVILPGGRISFVETKAPGGKPSPVQVRFIAKLRALGCAVHIIYSKEQIDNAYPLS